LAGNPAFHFKMDCDARSIGLESRGRTHSGTESPFPQAKIIEVGGA
jgi:hypothetical protein